MKLSRKYIIAKVLKLTWNYTVKSVTEILVSFTAISQTQFLFYKLNHKAVKTQAGRKNSLENRENKKWQVDRRTIILMSNENVWWNQKKTTKLAMKNAS